LEGHPQETAMRSGSSMLAGWEVGPELCRRAGAAIPCESR